MRVVKEHGRRKAEVRKQEMPLRGIPHSAEAFSGEKGPKRDIGSFFREFGVVADGRMIKFIGLICNGPS